MNEIVGRIGCQARGQGAAIVDRLAFFGDGYPSDMRVICPIAFLLFWPFSVARCVQKISRMTQNTGADA